MSHRGAAVRPGEAPERHRRGAAGYIATTLAAVMTSGIIAAIALSLPDIRRYLKISSM